MFPVATAATFARNVVHRGILLRFLKFSHGLSRYAGRAVSGRRWSIPGGSKARYGSARSAPDLSRMPVRSDGVPRVSRSLKTLCGWNVDTGQIWSAFEHILPLNQFERRFWWIILHLIGQGSC